MTSELSRGSVINSVYFFLAFPLRAVGVVLGQPCEVGS